MMGQFEAEFPEDRLYAKNHLWSMPLGGNRFRFGFSAYAVRLLQDVYFIEFSADPGTTVAHKQEFGTIESKKAESGLYAPIAGTIVGYNDRLLEDPSSINVDKYGEGWLMDMEGSGDDLLSPEQYVAHLEKAWEIAQRTIKGQANAE